MKPVATRLYAVLVALALVGLAAWAGADWYQQQQLALQSGQSSLRQWAGALSDLTLKTGTLSSTDAAAVLTKFTNNDSRWKVLVLHSPERGTEYYKGPRTSIPVDRAVPRWEPRLAAEVSFSLPVFRTGAPAMTLVAIYEFYGRTEIFGLLKAVGITLLILLVLTTVLVFIASRAERETQPWVNTTPTHSPGPSSPTAGVESHPEWDDEAPTLGEIPALSQEQDEEYWFDDELTMEDLPPLDSPPGGEPAEPSLFSPVSGLGWESFLATRLSNELSRASGQNQDLAVIQWSWRRTAVDARAWGQALKRAFPSMDLNFEQPHGAVVILPGRSLEQALQTARAFVNEADGLWPTAEVCAGVSARTGRLVETQTLLSEAQSALKRTLGGSVRVLGLKTDPDRYREYLASQSSSAHL